MFIHVLLDSYHTLDEVPPLCEQITGVVLDLSPSQCSFCSRLNGGMRIRLAKRHLCTEFLHAVLPCKVWLLPDLYPEDVHAKYSGAAMPSEIFSTSHLPLPDLSLHRFASFKATAQRERNESKGELLYCGRD